MLHKNTVLPSQTQVLRYEEELLCLCSIKREKIITQDKIENAGFLNITKASTKCLRWKRSWGPGGLAAWLGASSPGPAGAQLRAPHPSPHEDITAGKGSQLL